MTAIATLSYCEEIEKYFDNLLIKQGISSTTSEEIKIDFGRICNYIEIGLLELQEPSDLLVMTFSDKEGFDHRDGIQFPFVVPQDKSVFRNFSRTVLGDSDNPIHRATIAEILQEFGGLCMHSKVELLLWQERPDLFLVGISDQNDRQRMPFRFPIAVAIRRSHLVELARTVLQIEPPIEERILKELRGLRGDLKDK